MLNQATPKIIYLEENTHYSNNNFTILRFLLVLILVSKVSVGFFLFFSRQSAASIRRN